MKKFVSIKKHDDFGRAYRQGKSYGNKLLVMYVFERGQGHETRVGISVSKKVGNSVDRHRAVRLMREAYRLSDFVFPSGYDLLFIARNTINSTKCADVKKSIEAAAKRADFTV